MAGMDRIAPHSQPLRDREHRLAEALKAARPSLRLAMLFGSVAEGRARPDSDVDIGLLDEGPLDVDAMIEVAGAACDATGREVDIVDLHNVPQPVTGYVLRGKRLLGSDECFADLCTRHLIEREDFGRAREREVARRVAEWIR